MICKKCGSELPDDSLFCTECGASQAEEAPKVFTDDEPTSILPHLEEVIADNEEALSLTNEEVELLGDETAEILSTTDTIELPEPVSESEPLAEALPEPLAEEVIEEITEKPADFPKQQAPAAPVIAADNGFNDNSSTMKIPIQPEMFNSGGVHTNQFAGNNAPQQGGNTRPPLQSVQQPVPPVQQAPAPAPMPQQPAKKPKARKKVGGGRMIGASVVTVFTVIFLLLFSFILAVKVGANGNVIRGRAEKLDASTTLTSKYEGDELAVTFYDSMGFRTATRGAADKESFKRYMMNTDFRWYAGSVAKDYLDYIIDGEGGDPSITAEDFVNDFFKANKEAAKEEFGYELTNDGYELIEKNLEIDNFSQSMDVNEWGKKLGFGVDKLHYAFSYITIAALAVLVLLFLIWTAFIVGRRARFVTGFFGNTFTITGIIVFLAGLIVIVGSAIAFTFTHNVAYYLAESLLLPLSLILIIIGAAELVLGFIFRKSNRAIKKKAKKAAAEAAAKI